MLDSCLFVIFGATGDLAQRKLYPALYNLLIEGRLPEDFAIVGTGRRFETREAFINMVDESVSRFSRRKEPLFKDRFHRMLHYFRMDFANAAGFARLASF